MPIAFYKDPFRQDESHQLALCVAMDELKQPTGQFALLREKCRVIMEYAKGKRLILPFHNTAPPSVAAATATPNRHRDISVSLCWK